MLAVDCQLERTRSASGSLTVPRLEPCPSIVQIVVRSEAFATLGGKLRNHETLHQLLATRYTVPLIPAVFARRTALLLHSSIRDCQSANT